MGVLLKFCLSVEAENGSVAHRGVLLPRESPPAAAARFDRVGLDRLVGTQRLVGRWYVRLRLFLLLRLRGILRLALIFRLRLLSRLGRLGRRLTGLHVRSLTW